MNQLQLEQAIQNTPLTLPNGDPEWRIEDKADRGRLKLCLSIDPEVMIGLINECVRESYAKSDFRSAVSDSIRIDVGDHEEDDLSIFRHMAVFSAHVYDQLLSRQLDAYINDSAEGWLQLMREAEADDRPGQEIDAAMSKLS